MADGIPDLTQEHDLKVALENALHHARKRASDETRHLPEVQVDVLLPLVAEAGKAHARQQDGALDAIAQVFADGKWDGDRHTPMGEIREILDRTGR